MDSPVYSLDTSIVGDGIVIAGTYALNASTGAIIWNFSSAFITYYPFSCAAANGTLYVYANINSGKGGLYGLSEALLAFDINNGNKIWQFIFPSEHGGFDSYQDTNPIIANGMVYVGSRVGLYAFGTSSTPMPPSSTPIPRNDWVPYQWVLLTVVLVTAVVIALALMKRRGSKIKKALTVA